VTEAQLNALEFAAAVARGREPEAQARIGKVSRAAGCSPDHVGRVLEVIRSAARVVTHFHPDRYARNGCTVAESLLAVGVYRNQFETGLSAGSRTAFAGGSRDRWEHDLFGGAYHRPGVLPHERPKYGVLELVRDPDGPLPRFGSCYFVLRGHVLLRCSFTFGGSEQPGAIDRLGTVDHFLPVLAALMEEVADGGPTPVKWPPFCAPTLGVRNVTACAFLDRIARDLPADRPNCKESLPGRVLDSGIEAHVHGTISLASDVESLVVDAAFEGTSTADVLSALAAKFAMPLNWHCGYRLAAEDVPDDFRGPRMRPLAYRIARGGVIDAAAIGAAEATLHSSPDVWQDWGTPDEVLQYLKQLWHVLVHYGDPIRRSA
jgi:hypothetical protein